MNKRVQIYCDLDGVLVDFDKGIVDIGNKTINTYRENPEKYAYNEKLINLLEKLRKQDNGFKDYYPFEDFQVNEKGHRAYRNLVYFLVSKNKNWWINLEWTKDGKELWNNIVQYNPIILSSPIGPISAAGKRVWCEQQLGLSDDRVIIVDDKGIETDNQIVLIDDRMKAINQLEKVNGIGILHKTGCYQETIDKLNKLLRTLKM